MSATGEPRRRWPLALLLCALVAAALFGFRKQLSAVFVSPKTGPQSLVPLTWSDVRDAPGHRAHVGLKDVGCGDCHAAAAGTADAGASFASATNADSCVKCHAKEVGKTHGGKPPEITTCLSCHAFAKPAATCISCHDKTEGMHPAITTHKTPEAPCASCHNPHREHTAVAADCKGCHTKESGFAHGKMPPITDVARISGPGFDVHKGLPASHTGHATGACTDCHAPHTKGSAAKDTCIGCHQDKPAGPKPAAHDACITCHTPHAFERTAVPTCGS
ncbi:MAG: hypothetical protein HOO96_09305, partial [Polyangiaceae bacterium]|nr:hypothetical protein [Polyangiaceae bacterium]